MKREPFFKKIVLGGLVLALEMFAATLLLSFLLAFLYIPLRMLIHDRLLQDAVYGVLALSIEVVLMFVLFKLRKQNERKASIKELLLPMTVAFPLLLLIALFNGFYTYTAGPGASTLGRVLWCLSVGEYSNVQGHVPLYFLLLSFLAKLLLMAGAGAMGYKAGEKRLAKERKRILKQ